MLFALRHSLAIHVHDLSGKVGARPQTRTIDGPRSSSASAAASPPTRKLVDFRRVDSGPSDEPISHPCSGDPDERSGADGSDAAPPTSHPVSRGGDDGDSSSAAAALAGGGRGPYLRN